MHGSFHETYFPPYTLNLRSITPDTKFPQKTEKNQLEKRFWHQAVTPNEKDNKGVRYLCQGIGQFGFKKRVRK
jgi:hypothetical protein